MLPGSCRREAGAEFKDRVVCKGRSSHLRADCLSRLRMQSQGNAALGSGLCLAKL